MLRVLGLLGTLSLGGCSETFLYALDQHSLPQYRQSLSEPHNSIERSLTSCVDRTEAAEAACVREGLLDSDLSPADIKTVAPGCRTGQVCHLLFTTEDCLGYLDVTAALYRAHWRVDIDLSRAVRRLEDLPITVKQV